MIGKMQDMVTAAVVVSAADNKGSRYTSETKASSQNTQSDGNAVVKSAVQTDGVDAINAAGNPQETEVANTRSTLMLVSTVVHVQHSAQ